MGVWKRWNLVTGLISIHVGNCILGEWEGGGLEETWRVQSVLSSEMEASRWWMGCQPHIRVLRGVVRSRLENRDVEASLHKCVSLYMADIHAHSLLEDDKVLLAITGGEVTAMEASFMWLGGWRPSCAVMLAYSLMGVQLRDEIRSFGLGITKLVRSEAILSDQQLLSLRDVQNRAREEEKKLTKKLASIQMLVGDQDVVAAVILESSPDRAKKTDLKTVLKSRVSRLRQLLVQADNLRLRTLHQLFLVLSPVQVAHCAIAAFELAFSMHALGISDESSRVQSIPAAQSSLPPRLPSRNPSLGFDSLKRPQLGCVRLSSESSLGKESVNLNCHRSSCKTK